MTTIAFRDGILAADSAATWDDGVRSRVVKMWEVASKVDPVKGRCLLATAGDLYSALLFKDWLEAGGDPRLHERGVGDSVDFEAVIVHKSGLYSANRFCRITENVEPYWAAGSGCKYALAAMRCGRSAVEAVRVAMDFDPYTAGRINSMTLDPAPRRAAKKVVRGKA